jgi:membrane-associated protease RseP (regulator of RpoE activity)
MDSPHLPPFTDSDRDWIESPTRGDELLRALWPSEPRPSAWRAWGRNALLFVLSAVSIYLCGGPLLVVGLMSILFAHEMGHYLACRYYNVDATLPFFIPGLWLPLGGWLGWVPIPFVGTFGAVIRIKSPIPHRTALFDIGIAGPLAGFVVCIPVLVLGVLEGHWTPITNGGEGPGYFGEPLLFQWAVRLILGPAPDGMTLGIGPLGLAAWFGLFVTALNMMPVGQLDGGHVTFALWPRYARHVSRVGLVVCLALLYFRPVWLLWTILLWVLGRRPHPPPTYDFLPVNRGRLLVGLLGFAILAVSFTPDPILLSWKDFFGG